MFNTTKAAGAHGDGGVRRRLGGRSGSWVVLACLGGALSGLDTTVNIAFPAITEAFELDVADISWVVVCYVLSYAIVLLPAGRLSDAVGHGRVVATGLVVSIAAFLMCGLAGSFPLFLAGRVAQGVGIALVLAASPALVMLAVEEEHRARALGRFQACVALGLAAGPPLGGLMVGLTSWRSVYLFRAPIALGMLVVAAAAGMVHRPATSSTRTSWRDLDPVGALALAGGLGGVLFAVSRASSWGWTAPATLATAGAGAVALAVFVAAERRARDPLLDLRLFEVRGFAAANVVNALANASMFAIWLLGPYLVIDVLDHGPVAGGLLLGSAAVTAAVAASVAGRLVERVGAARLVVVGLLVEASGLVVTSRLGASSSPVAVALAFGLVGAGLGLFQVPNMSFVMGSIPRSRQGVAGSLTQMVRTVGVVSGVAGANALFVVLRDAELDAGAATERAAFPAAFTGVLVVAALVALSAAVLAVIRRPT